MNLKNVVAVLKIVHKSSGLIKPLVHNLTHLNLIKHSDIDSETSDHPPPVFVPEGGNGAVQAHEDDESIIPINATEGEPPNIPFVESNDDPVASNSASVVNSHNPNKPDHLHKSNQIWEYQSGCLH